MLEDLLSDDEYDPHYGAKYNGEPDGADPWAHPFRKKVDES